MKQALTLILTFLTIFAIAENDPSAPGKGVITGIIYDKQLNTPVEYANVALYNQSDSTLVNGSITSAEGVFVIEDIPFGTYYLSADFIGYTKIYVTNITLNKDEPVKRLEKIELEQAVEIIEGVEVVGEKSYIEYKIDKKVVNVSQHANAAGGTAVDVLENVPSVNVDIDGNVSLRGSGNFTVLIDGKPTVLDGNEILKQLPASAIENIEIITNPSAKYDPDGTSGIINIVMKKESRTGMNGIVNTSVGTSNAWNFKRSGDFLINYRANKVNYFVSARYGNEPMYRQSTALNKTYLDTVTKVSDFINDRNTGTSGWNTKAGVDYYMNEKNSLSFSGEVGQFVLNRDFMSTYHFYDEGVTGTSRYEANHDVFRVDGIYYNMNLNYQKKFNGEGHQLDFSGYYSYWDGLTTDDADKYITTSSWDTLGLIPTKHRSDNINLTDDYRFKLDYTKPMANGSKLEAGGQVQVYYTDYNYLREEKDADADIWYKDTVYSNQMEFLRDIFSGYVTYGGMFKGIGYQAGLRGEYTWRTLTQKTTDEDYLYERMTFFPSFALSKQLKKDQQVSLSYSRRINRPQPWFLNPFPDYTDNLIVSRGNPALEPELIDSYEFNYFKRIKASFVSAGLYYRQNNNAMTQTITMVDTMVYVQQANLNKTKACGLELAGNVQIKKWWSIYSGINLFYYNIDGEINNESIDTSAITFNYNFNNTFKIKKHTRIQLNVYYNAPSIAMQGSQKGFITGGIAIRHDFMKRKATLTLNVRDPLGMFKYHLLLDNPTFLTDFRMINEAPVLRLSFSYRINNYERRQQQEEQMNVGGGGMF